MNIVKNEKYKFEIHCTSGEIYVDTVSGTLVEKEEKEKEEKPKEPEESEKEKPTEEIIYNVSNCDELATILKIKDNFDPSIAQFAFKYRGETIEFDANTAAVMPHDGFKTRFDYLIYAWDYSETSVSGPSFQFEDVNYYDLNLVGDNVPDSFGVGLNIHVIAIVDEYDSNSGLFKLEPVEIRMR